MDDPIEGGESSSNEPTARGAEVPSSFTFGHSLQRAGYQEAAEDELGTTGGSVGKTVRRRRGQPSRGE
jgi:hypothetical protein